jgi:hypothetical protein
MHHGVARMLYIVRSGCADGHHRIDIMCNMITCCRLLLCRRSKTAAMLAGTGCFYRGIAGNFLIYPTASLRCISRIWNCRVLFLKFSIVGAGVI